jgi:hypothetical protein
VGELETGVPDALDVAPEIVLVPLNETLVRYVEEEELESIP